MRLLQRLKLAPALFCGMAASENRDGQVRVVKRPSLNMTKA